MMLGKIRKHYTTIDSTNRIARDLVLKGALEGTVVTAEYQTAGRGRRERKWISTHSNSVLASYILYPDVPPERWGGFPLAVALAVRLTIHDVAGAQAALKWPNDVLIQKKKVCGILVESGMGTTPWMVAGIGININQPDFPGDYRQQPTSLFVETKKKYDIDQVIRRLSEAMDEYYSIWRDMGNTAITEAWKQHSEMMGSPITVDSCDASLAAVAEDLAEDGSLIIRLEDGMVQHVYAGDVTIRW